MKPFAKRMLALASAAAIMMSAIPAVCGTGLQAAGKEEQISARVCTTRAAVPASRGALCSMVMNSYRTLTGLTDADLGETRSLFLDTEDTDVLNAYRLGLVSEKTDGHFAPEEVMSRQDFFTTAVRLLELLGYTYIDRITMDLTVFEDADQLMAYAVQPTQVLLCIEAIDPDAALEPQRPITDEEAQALLDRMAAFFTEWELDPVAPARYLGEDVAEFALNYVGCRYARGGQSPRAFDCSGFVYYVYSHFDYDLEPGARNQWSILDRSVNNSDLLPGDLLFFSSNGRASRIFHVGIYIGDGQFVHAANSRKGLIVTDVDDAWYAARYLGAKRVIE